MRASRLGIELAKTMSLNYSNQETSVTIGESVRDEDGNYLHPEILAELSADILFTQYSFSNRQLLATLTTD
jgi:ribose-phosphate pyrophosphokinase